VKDGDFIVSDGILKTVEGQPVRIADKSAPAGAADQKNDKTPAGK